MMGDVTLAESLKHIREILKKIQFDADNNIKVNVQLGNITTTGETYLLDTAGARVDPATLQKQDEISGRLYDTAESKTITDITKEARDKLASLDGKVTKCDTDKTKIVDSTDSYTLAVDDSGRASTVSKAKNVLTGNAIVDAGATSVTTISVDATEKVAVYVTARDYNTGNSICAAKLGVRVIADPDAYEYSKVFCGGFHVVLDGGFDEIKLFADNRYRARKMLHEWKIFVW